MLYGHQGKLQSALDTTLLEPLIFVYSKRHTSEDDIARLEVYWTRAQRQLIGSDGPLLAFM